MKVLKKNKLGLKKIPNLINQTTGGEDRLGAVWSVDQRAAFYKNIMSTVSYPVYQYDLQGNFIQKFNTVFEAAQLTGLRRENISQCCRGMKHSHGKFMWKKKYQFKIKPHEITIKKPSQSKYKAVDAYKIIDNSFVGSFESIGEAAKTLKVDDPNIHKCLRGVYKQTKGYQFYEKGKSPHP